MTPEVGKPAIVRFPGDVRSAIAVAMVYEVRDVLALVAKWGGHSTSFASSRRWVRQKRWVPLADVARLATPREVQVGLAIDPVPARAA